jgi:hypothetical protein
VALGPGLLETVYEADLLVKDKVISDIKDGISRIIRGTIV